MKSPFKRASFGCRGGSRTGAINGYKAKYTNYNYQHANNKFFHDEFVSLNNFVLLPF